MLSISQLNKSYLIDEKSVSINKNINLTVQNGQLIWIKGKSGAGKTTFLNMISGIDSFDSGEIIWNDFNFNNKSRKELADFRLQKCGLIFQFFELLKTQNSMSNAMLPLRLASKNDDNLKKFIINLFDEFEISDLKQKKPAELSGGEKQRVSIIRALALQPEFLIADEITASLDNEMSNKVYRFLKNYLKQKNGIGIFVSHDPVIKEYVDDCYFMENGSLSKCTC